MTLFILFNVTGQRLGTKLAGKIHIYVGDMDNYYLNNAVYTAEEMIKKLENPKCNCEVDYGDRAEHCWNGDHDNPIMDKSSALSSNVYSQMGRRSKKQGAARCRSYKLEILNKDCFNNLIN